MSSLLLGLLAAFAAAGLYSVGIALQASEARALSRQDLLRISLFRRLIRRPRWLLGIAIDFSGWTMQAVALGLAPLTVVQPALAVGVVFLLAIGARALGEHVGRRELLGVVGVAAGVSGLGWAAPAHVSHHDTGVALILALVLLGALALMPLVLARASGSIGIFVGVGAGLAFSWDGLATKFFTDDFSNKALPGVLLWPVGMFVAAGLGTLSQNSALQSRPVTQIAPIVFAMTTVVPVVLAPFVADEGWDRDSFTAGVLLVSLLTVVCGAIQLTRSPAVAAVMDESGRAARGVGLEPSPGVSGSGS